MGIIRKKIKDVALLRLIRRFLQSGIMLGGVEQAREEGTPQGGPLSPLMSNILLNEFDQELKRRGHRFVRYADDCSIFLRSRAAARRVLASITRFVEGDLHLEVNREKTKIVRPVKFVLLGHAFTPTYKKGERAKYRLSIAKKSWDSLRRKIKALTRKTDPVPLTERIAKPKPPDAGLGELFQTGHRLREIRPSRRLDQEPAALLYLEVVETSGSSLSGIPTVGG
ncbi:MAG: hypothetical protein JNJ57_21840 [Saprospiraceae bacterium]|nr:hypothetical protein [Saprospiraceae bacterium]